MSTNISRKINFSDELESVELTLNNPVARYSKNPIITPEDVNRVWKSPEYQVVTVHNAGTTIYDGEVLMLFRSHLRCGISVLGISRSKDGITGWKIDSRPALVPAKKSDIFAKDKNRAELIENESGGLEDPRITKINDEYIITYSAYHNAIPDRVRVSMITTKDFKTFIRRGPVLNLDMRNVVIFPEKIKNKFWGLFRPNDHTDSHTGGIFSQIKTGYSEDYKNNTWTMNNDPIFETGKGPSAFQSKIGPCAPPIYTDEGWLSIFHGVRGTMDGNPYVLGIMLHDLKDPSKIKVCSMPILFPSSADCRVSSTNYVHVPNVVFCCGAISYKDGRILVYYGGNDTVMNVAVTHKDILLSLCKNYGQDPITGKLLYSL